MEVLSDGSKVIHVHIIELLFVKSVSEQHPNIVLEMMIQ